MNGKRTVIRLFATLGLTALVVSLHAGSARAAGPGLKTAQTTVDGVHLTVTSGFLPSPQFIASQPGSSTQAATSSAPPSQSLTITAVPFGTKAGTESLPVASANASPAYRADLRNDRVAQHGAPASAPPATILGQSVPGQISTPVLPLGAQDQSAVVIEWVATVGQRIWLVRATNSLADAGTEQAFAEQLSGLVITASDPSGASTVPGAAGGPPSGSSAQRPAGGETPGPSVSLDAQVSSSGPARATSVSNGINAPSWWSGACDTQDYGAATGMSSYPLGAGYLGMPACGPRPLFGGTDNLVYFFPGSWGVYEWECVELAMRYLYTGYGVPPYSANGNQVVANYSGTQFQKISNSTPNRAPVPGDVLSYGPATTFGHTSIVTGSSVDGNGNGWLSVIEENNSPGGASTLQISNWTVQAFEPVSGWLHPLTGMGGTADPTLADASAVSWGPGRIDVFARGADGSLEHRWQSAPPAWGGWESLGGQLVSSMSAVSWASNRLDVFARGTDGALWHRWWDGSEWGGWESLGGGLSSDPVAVSWGAGRLDVFATGWDGGLWHLAFDGTRWLPWAPMGSVVLGEPAVVSPGTGRLDVFGRGVGNDVRWISYGPGGWSSWTSLGGYITADPSAVLTPAGQEYLFVRGITDEVWYLSRSGGSWGGFQALGGVAVGAALALAGTGVDAFVEGTDHALWGNALNGWTGLGGVAYADPVGVSTGGGSMYLFGENVNGDWSGRSPSSTSASWTALGAP